MSLHVPTTTTREFHLVILFFCGFLSSLTSFFIICGDFNAHVDTDCTDQQKFLDLLDSSNLAQSVNKPTHLHGHILDLILSLSDSNFVSNVTVCDLVSDHALVKRHLDFACPASPKVGSISYHRYHKIRQKFRDDLANISIVLSPASTAADLYDQYVHNLGCLLDGLAPLICGKIKKEPAGWCMWHKDRSQLSRTRLYRQIAQCNAIINRDKAEYYSTVINDNSHDPKKLWQMLQQVLNKGSEMTLPPHQSDKSLANQFASFFTQKIKRI